MPHNSLDPRHTALLFFDVLNGQYRGMSEAVQQQMAPVVANCVRLAGAARRVGIPVFYTKPDHRPDGLDSAELRTDTDMVLRPWRDPENDRIRSYLNTSAGSWNAEVVDEIKPLPGDYVILKHRWNAFYQTNLELSLRTRGIDTIVLCGVATDIGIASTAYGARDRDFQLVIVRDACRGAYANNHDVLVSGVFPRMARVRTTEQVIEMMNRGAEAAEGVGLV